MKIISYDNQAGVYGIGVLQLDFMEIVSIYHMNNKFLALFLLLNG